MLPVEGTAYARPRESLVCWKVPSEWSISLEGMRDENLDLHLLSLGGFRSPLLGLTRFALTGIGTEAPLWFGSPPCLRIKPILSNLEVKASHIQAPYLSLGKRTGTPAKGTAHHSQTCIFWLPCLTHPGLPWSTFPSLLAQLKEGPYTYSKVTPLLPNWKYFFLWRPISCAAPSWSCEHACLLEGISAFPFGTSTLRTLGQCCCLCSVPQSIHKWFF